MKITKHQIHEIAEYLEIGQTVYVNKDTGEYIPIVENDDFIDYMGDEEENPWAEDQRTVESWENYFSIGKMPSHEGFKIMEAFASVVDDALRVKIGNALTRRKPFAHFKDLVESSDYRQQWFDFRQRKYKEYVIDELEANDMKIEKEV